MSQVQVKWVNPKDLHDEKPVWDKAELFVIPVVPLSALRTALELIANRGTDVLTKEGIAANLLAQLPEE